MRKITLSSTVILGAMLALLLPVQATSLRTWVSGTGTNNALCSRTSPCATFQAAHDATTGGGEISCIDAGEYGQVTISKAISIICDNTEAGIAVGPGAFGIQVAAGATDIITLQGLDIEGAGSAVFGIDFQSGGVLHVQKVKIRNFRGNINGNSGIVFRPASYAELYVVDSYISDCGISGLDYSGGISIAPSGGGSVNASINRVRLENNFTGIFLLGSNSTGAAVNVVMLDSVVAGSAANGVAAVTTAGHTPITVLFDHSLANFNFGSGISADGAAANGAGSATVRIGDATISNNVTGVSTTNQGVVQSFKNNRISGNFTDGTPIPAFPGPGGTALQ